MKRKSLQFPQTSAVVFSYDQDECILFNFHFLIWTSAWNDLQLLRLSVSDCVFLLYV